MYFHHCSLDKFSSPIKSWSQNLAFSPLIKCCSTFLMRTALPFPSDDATSFWWIWTMFCFPASEMIFPHTNARSFFTCPFLHIFIWNIQMQIWSPRALQIALAVDRHPLHNLDQGPHCGKLALKLLECHVEKSTEVRLNEGRFKALNFFKWTKTWGDTCAVPVDAKSRLNNFTNFLQLFHIVFLPALNDQLKLFLAQFLPQETRN